LQAEEIAEHDRRRLLSHADACRDCSRRLEVEDGFLRALKGRLGRVEVPPGLEGAIRDALARETPVRRSGSGSSLRTRGASALAAAVLLGGLLVPAILEGPGRANAIGSDALRIVKATTIVDRDCDAAGRSTAEQRTCRNARHVNVLKVGGAVYWNVNLDHPLAKDIVLDPDQRGRRVMVVADFYPDLRTVHLISVRPAVPPEL
jgi:hypothetical protein